MTGRRLASCLCVLASAACASPRAPADDAHDHRLFACAPNGLEGGQPFGCQSVGRADVVRFPNGPVYWHLMTFRTRADAEAVRHPADVVAETEGRVWLFSFGLRPDVRAGAQPVASVGPLPIPRALSYRVEVYRVVMPPAAYTVVHTHPGPEAWYLLAGEQCLETPDGTIRARAGEGTIGPPGGTAMRLTNSGTGERRAFFIVVHDANLPWSTPSDWRPTGACDGAAERR
jgi:quercetin dioxygenase-like cupin family protein